MSRRPSFTREERCQNGMDLCRTPGCSRAPSNRGYCRPCYNEAPRIRRPREAKPKALTYHLQAHIPLDLALAMKLEAARQNVSLVRLLVEVLTPIAATWGRPPSERP